MINATINWISFDLHVLNCQLRTDQTGVKSAEKYSSRRVFLNQRNIECVTNLQCHKRLQSLVAIRQVAVILSFAAVHISYCHLEWCEKCVWQHYFPTTNGNGAMTGRLDLQQQHEGHPWEGCNGQMFYGQTLLQSVFRHSKYISILIFINFHLSTSSENVFVILRDWAEMSPCFQTVVDKSRLLTSTVHILTADLLAEMSTVLVICLLSAVAF